MRVPATSVAELRRRLAQAEGARMPIVVLPSGLPGLRTLHLDEREHLADTGGLRRWLDFHFPEAA